MIVGRGFRIFSEVYIKVGNHRQTTQAIDKTGETKNESQNRRQKRADKTNQFARTRQYQSTL